MNTGFVTAIGLISATILAGVNTAGAADAVLPLPDVTITAPGPTNTPPYLLDPPKSFGRNPYQGRYRVEEDKFARVPCSETRIAAAGATCLRGYKLEPSDPGSHVVKLGGCDLALDVVAFDNPRISVEANVLIFDPYKVNALGSVPKNCYVRGYLDYDATDFRDMNQMTRRGTNFRNLVSSGDDKSIEFNVSNRYCKAIRQSGPRWHGGYIYIANISICRNDTTQVQAEDIATVFAALRIRIYDKDGNLRAAE
jgi:hypothetical protein